jgi:hypothetical protein
MAQLIGMLGAGSGAAMGAGTGMAGAAATGAAASGAAAPALGAGFTANALGAAPMAAPAAGGGGFLEALNRIQQFRSNPLTALSGGQNGQSGPQNPFLQAMQGQLPKGIQQVAANPLPQAGGKR